MVAMGRRIGIHFHAIVHGDDGVAIRLFIAQAHSITNHGFQQILFLLSCDRTCQGGFLTGESHDHMGESTIILRGIQQFTGLHRQIALSAGQMQCHARKPQEK